MAALSGWLGNAWSSLTNTWADGPTYTYGAGSWSLYDEADSSPQKALASQFLVTNVPVSNDPALLWSVMGTDFLAAQMMVVAAQSVHGAVPDSEMTKAESYISSMLDSNASTWLEAAKSGATSVEMQWGGDMTKYLVVLMSYCFRVAAAGMSLHEPSAAADVIQSGKMTAAQLHRDYLLRRGVFQAITTICNQKPVADLLFKRDGASGIGVLPVLAIVAIVLIVAAAIAFIIVGIYSIKKSNEVLTQQLDKCAELYSTTGTQSPGCTKLYEAAATPPAAIDLPTLWTNNIFLYGSILVGGGLLVYFMPMVVTKVGESIKAAKAQRA
jgi:hypothetical protein